MTFDYLEITGRSDIGKVRGNNEDAFLCLAEQGLFVLADGMGGAAAGEVASAYAIEALQQAFQKPLPGPTTRAQAVIAAANQASQRIRDFADGAGLRGTGTTLVSLLLDPWNPGQARALHVGDSRLYRWRDDTLLQITTDHTVAAAAGVTDEMQLPPLFRGVLTRALGLERDVALEIQDVELKPGDLFFLCSDGLTRMVPDKPLAKLLKKQRKQSLLELAEILIAAANAAGGVDNITVILLRVAPVLPAPYVPSSAERQADSEPADSATAAELDGDPPTPITATPPTDAFHNRPTAEA